MKTVKNYHGKAIYQPAGKLPEYGEWGCNFYIGCSNGAAIVSAQKF